MFPDVYVQYFAYILLTIDCLELAVIEFSSISLITFFLQRCIIEYYAKISVTDIEWTSIYQLLGADKCLLSIF